MAVDVNSVEVVAKPFPFQQQASFNATRYSTVPWGQAIVNENLDTTVIGAGNTGVFIIDIELPADYVALLRNWQLQIHDTQSISWGNTMLGMAYQQPGGPYRNSVGEYPDQDYSWYQLVGDEVSILDRFGSARYFKNFLFGFTSGTTPVMFSDSYDPTQVPLWIPPTVDNTFKARQLTCYMFNNSASQPAQDLTIRASFDLYTFEQAYSAAVMSSPRTFS